jgi:hypothetical protein
LNNQQKLPGPLIIVRKYGLTIEEAIDVYRQQQQGRHALVLGCSNCFTPVLILTRDTGMAYGWVAAGNVFRRLHHAREIIQ